MIGKNITVDVVQKGGGRGVLGGALARKADNSCPPPLAVTNGLQAILRKFIKFGELGPSR